MKLVSLRLPEGLIEELKSKAKADDRTFNNYVTRVLTGQQYYDRFKQEFVADESVSYNGDMLGVARRATGIKPTKRIIDETNQAVVQSLGDSEVLAARAAQKAKEREEPKFEPKYEPMEPTA